MKLLRNTLLCLFFTVLIIHACAQDSDYAKFVVKTLASPDMKGRGYVGNGDKMAARFIARQYKKHGLIPLTPSYLQKYQFSINSFPGRMALYADGKLLTPGEDYLVALSSEGQTKAYGIQWLLNDSIAGSPKWKFLLEQDLKNTLVVTDKFHRHTADSNLLHAGGYIYLRDSSRFMVWRASDGQKTKPWLMMDIKEGILTPSTRSVFIDFESQFIESHETSNVIGMIRGRVCQDTFFVVTAHYDHLGMMGENTLFPGANDNASGVATLLDLCRHFSIPGYEPYYSMIFIATSGEEVGLLGAEHCAKNLPVPAQQVKFLVNLDMVGTGSEGITLVNGTKYEKAAQCFQNINESKKYLPQVRLRGESCNSDHCPFDKTGIPSVFIYTMGKEWRHYHNTGDTSDGPPFTGYQGLFDLLRDFFNTYGRK